MSPVRHIHHNGKGIDVPLDPEDASAGIGPRHAVLYSCALPLKLSSQRALLSNPTPERQPSGVTMLSVMSSSNVAYLMSEPPRAD